MPSSIISPAEQVNPVFSSPFRSFWQAGYECADLVNNRGERVDLLAMTGHDRQPAAHYAALAPFGIKTVREGIRWAHVERRPGQYRWTEVRQRLTAAREQGIQQVWDICHFGYPADLSPLHPQFERRFVAVCEAFARLYHDHTDEPLLVTPINEMSFISWLGGEVAGTTPFAARQGFEVKRRLAGAYIAGAAAIRAVAPSTRLLSTEPLINIVPPPDAGGAADHLLAEVRAHHEAQFQAWDLLSGRMCPELGGQPDVLDLVGVNFYYDNQWVHQQGRLRWEDSPRDPRWTPLHQLMQHIWDRYQRPLVLAETSHPGVDRPHWIRETAAECCRALAEGIPLLGICLYPILDRPDWDDLSTWHRAGLWDARLPLPPDGAPPVMELYEPYAEALRAAQRLLPTTPAGFDRATNAELAAIPELAEAQA